MKRIFFSLFVGLTMFSIVNAQTIDLSTDPENPTSILPNTNVHFQTFQLNPQSNQALPNPAGMREYFNQNYYFSFVMPENLDVNVFMQFPESLDAEMIAYAYSSGVYLPMDMSYMTSSPSMFTINQLEIESGTTVVVRLVFSEDATGETIQLALKKQEAVVEPKAILVDNGVYTPQELVEDILVTGCLQAFNVTYNGDPLSIGYFMGNVGSSGFDEGIILSSGYATDAEGPDISTSTGSTTTGGSDSDLAALNPGFTINDAAVLEFDFIPASDELVFDFIFGSEEFHEFANSSYNDVFGFFLSGPGITGPYSNNAINIALLPNGDPVTIDDTYLSLIHI